MVAAIRKHPHWTPFQESPLLSPSWKKLLAAGCALFPGADPKSRKKQTENSVCPHITHITNNAAGFPVKGHGPGNALLQGGVSQEVAVVILAKSMMSSPVSTKYRSAGHSTCTTSVPGTVAATMRAISINGVPIPEPTL